MDSAQPTWDHYRSFLAVLRTGSLSGAARSLGVTQPTIGRHIAMLEEALGNRALFTRSQTGLLPTNVARELRPHAEAMAAAADALQRSASAESQEPRGVVRITASEVIGAEVLPPILTLLRSLQRGIAIELAMTNQNVDLLRGDADIAVRMAPPKQKALLAKHIGKTWLGFHAHRRYVETHGLPQRLEDLAQHAVIGFDHVPPYIGSIKNLPDVLSRDAFAFRTDSDLAQLAAIRAGFGIGICQYGVARRDAGLIAILPRQLALSFDIWVVMHEDQKRVQRMRIVFDHLVSHLQTYVALSTRFAR